MYTSHMFIRGHVLNHGSYELFEVFKGKCLTSVQSPYTRLFTAVILSLRKKSISTSQKIRSEISIFFRNGNQVLFIKMLVN